MPTLKTLSSWLADAVSEGRAALRSLRGAAKGSSTLEESIQDALEDCVLGGSLTTELILRGAPRPLQPIVHEEALRIIREAINNACNHSEGNAIHVIADYNSQFIVIIRDDGRGINHEIIRSGRDGHFGIVGMKERAQRIGGKLTIRRRPEGGTEIEIAIPRSLAYLSRPGLFSRIRLRLKYGRTV
jgi:signal transduction histidine kinase